MSAVIGLAAACSESYDFAIVGVEEAVAALRGGWKGRPVVVLGKKEGIPMGLHPLVSVVARPVKHVRLVIALLKATALMRSKAQVGAHYRIVCLLLKCVGRCKYRFVRAVLSWPTLLYHMGPQSCMSVFLSIWAIEIARRLDPVLRELISGALLRGACSLSTDMYLHVQHVPLHHSTASARAAAAAIKAFHIGGGGSSGDGSAQRRGRDSDGQGGLGSSHGQDKRSAVARRRMSLDNSALDSGLGHSEGCGTI